MAAKDLPDPELLRKLLRYEPETGKLFWRERPREMFIRYADFLTWNTRYAGKEAFTSKDNNGYRQGSIFKKMHKAHRVILAIAYGEYPSGSTDHINGDPGDNRLENLRATTQAENMRNTAMPKNNTSGVVGVYWFKRTNAWRAAIKVGGKNKHLGYFKSKDSAIAARAAAEIEHGFHENHGRST